MVTKKTSTKKASEKKTSARITKAKEPAHIGLVKNDSYLAPYEDAIRGRHEHAGVIRLLSGGSGSRGPAGK